MTYIELKLDEQESKGKTSQEVFSWFIEIIPERLKVLESYITQDMSFLTWRADFSDESLNAANNWFKSQIATRIRTDQELEVIKNEMRLPSIKNVSKETIDYKTNSLCVDIGIYIGECLNKKNPGIEWATPLNLRTKNKRSSGFPVLKGNKNIIDPVASVQSLAVMYSQQVYEYDLSKIFKIFSEKLR